MYLRNNSFTLPRTWAIQEVVTWPWSFTAVHVYTPLSSNALFVISSVLRCVSSVILMRSEAVSGLESFSHWNDGMGFPRTSQDNLNVLGRLITASRSSRRHRGLAENKHCHVNISHIKDALNWKTFCDHSGVLTQRFLDERVFEISLRCHTLWSQKLWYVGVN